MKPRVSIVIASYNHAQFIEAAIQSVLDQSFQDFEIVITDDCSSDNSVELIKQFQDSRIILHVLPENCGPSTAMNECIKRSRGEFIANLGSDDYFLPVKLRKQVQFLDSRPDIAAVFGMPRFVDEVGANLGGGYREFSFPFRHENPSRYDWLRHFFFKGNCLCHPTVLIRKSIHDEIGCYDRCLMALADFDLWVRVCLKHNIFVMQEELIGRRVLKGNRNLSAPRKDSILRDAFERSLIGNQFAKMSSADFDNVFAESMAASRIDSRLPQWIKLARLAFTTDYPGLHLFGLNLMLSAGDKSDHECREAIKAIGHIDVFGLEARMELQRLRQRLPNLFMQQ